MYYVVKFLSGNIYLMVFEKVLNGNICLIIKALLYHSNKDYCTGSIGSRYIHYECNKARILFKTTDIEEAIAYTAMEVL